MGLATTIREWILKQLVGQRLVARSVDEQPDSLEPGFVYLVGSGGKPWSASFVCPCGCSSIIQLSLLQQDRPRWKAVTHFDGSVSLAPSVRRTKGCKSHFFVRRGRIVWAHSWDHTHTGFGGVRRDILA